MNEAVEVKIEEEEAGKKRIRETRNEKAMPLKHTAEINPFFRGVFRRYHIIYNPYWRLLMKTTFNMVIVMCLLNAIFSGCSHETVRITAKTDGITPLKVQANRIVDSIGNIVILKGLNICYPSILIRENHWNEEYFKEMASWGAKLIRVPIDPGSYRRFGSKKTFQVLDQAVQWAKRYGMYVMIDWHSIGNIVSGIFQDPWQEEMKTTAKETKKFWSDTAQRYKKEPTVAFYEIFNEPASMHWKGGSMSWQKWRDVADEIIDAIYAQNPAAIPVVGGMEWAYDLRDAAEAPLRNKGIVFAVHPYPGHAGQPWEDNWEEDFGYLAKDYPMMLTEFGFDPDDKIMPSVYKADNDYGRRILAYADKKGMSWTAFVFCNCESWPMPLFKDWETYTPTESGAFFKEQLNKQ